MTVKEIFKKFKPVSVCATDIETKEEYLIYFPKGKMYQKIKDYEVVCYATYIDSSIDIVIKQMKCEEEG